MEQTAADGGIVVYNSPYLPKIYAFGKGTEKLDAADLPAADVVEYPEGDGNSEKKYINFCRTADGKLMENKVREISAEEGENLSLRGYNAGAEYVVILHMRHISTWDGFAEALGNAFQLPMRGEGVDGTADWMQDLS